MRTPNHILTPHLQDSIRGSLPGNGRFLRIPGGGCRFGNCRAYPAPARSFQSAPRQAHRLRLLAPQKAPPASAPGSPGRCSPAALPAASTQTCLPAARAEVPAEVPGRQDSPAITAGRGARLPRAPSPQPRSARSPVPLAPSRPRAARGERSDAARAQDAAAGLPGAAGVRAEPRRRSERARSGAERAAGSGRASERRALHMLTRAARGQRPAAAGS